MTSCLGRVPKIVSVSGTVLCRSCFRFFALSCYTWSIIVRWRPSPSAAIVTQLVTRLRARGESPDLPGGSVRSGALNQVPWHWGQAPRGHSSTLDVTLSAKGMASPHSSIIVSHRILSNFLNGSLFL